MSSYSLAQIQEFIGYFFIKSTEEHFCLILTPEGKKLYLEYCYRNQHNLLFPSSYCVIWFFFSFNGINSNSKNISLDVEQNYPENKNGNCSSAYSLYSFQGNSTWDELVSGLEERTHIKQEDEFLFHWPIFF